MQVLGFDALSAALLLRSPSYSQNLLKRKTMHFCALKARSEEE